MCVGCGGAEASDTRTALTKRKRVVRDARGFPQLCTFRCARCLPSLSVHKRLPCPLLSSNMPAGFASVEEGGEVAAVPRAAAAAGRAQDAGLGAAGRGADAAGRAASCALGQIPPTPANFGEEGEMRKLPHRTISGSSGF